MTNASDEQLLELASRHVAEGSFDQAEAVYRDLLTRYPGNLDLMHEVGVQVFRQGRYTEARPWIEQAIAGNPAIAIYHNTLGLVLHELGEYEAALGCFERALRLSPELVTVFYNAGNTRLAQQRFDAAIACYQRVLAQLPDHEWTHLHLGKALARKGDFRGAIDAYRQAVQVRPRSKALWNSLGNAFAYELDWESAAHAYRQAIDCDPAAAAAWSNLGNALREVGLLGEALDCSRRSVVLDPSLADAHSNLIFNLQLQPGIGRADLAAECRGWWLRHGEKWCPTVAPVSADRSPERRLRVGYVSPDLRDHPVGRHLLPVVRCHDPQAVEVVCYFDAHPGDATTAQFRGGASVWRETAGWSDDRFAAQVREDGIDLLVDLAQHTAGNRLTMFARQPAPVQISFAGYPGATGLETIRWRLTDRFLDPEDGPESGRAFRLADSFWLFDPLGVEAEIGERPARCDGSVVFGCLSRFCKVNELVLELWGELLQRVPRSRLLLLCPFPAARARVLAKFAALGIDGSRIEFTGNLPRADYLALYRRIDVVLDPFPYNGHMTTCDALWMGVPIVSLAGDVPVSRGGLSLLSTVGFSEWVAFSPAEYLRIAEELAVAKHRPSELRARVQVSPLMDAPRFTRGIEAAYRTIWREWCAGQEFAG